MPHQTNRELADSVKNTLPENGQRISREALNSASEQFPDLRVVRDGQSRQETAHQIAWAAAKKKYQFQDLVGAVEWIAG